MALDDIQEVKTKINSKNLSEYSEELDEIFTMYIEDINPFIVRFEVTKGEFSAEIQNEIRALYGHLVRAAMAESSKMVQNRKKISKLFDIFLWRGYYNNKGRQLECLPSVEVRCCAGGQCLMSFIRV
jgi:hypothetical protein